MKLMRTCQEVTRLVLQGQDRDLTVGERLGVRMHMVVCQACPKFRQQVVFMRQAMGRWKQYGENGDPDGKPPG